MNDVTAPQENTITRRNAYYIFTLLFLLYFFDYVDRTVVTSLAPFIHMRYVYPARFSGDRIPDVFCRGILLPARSGQSGEGAPSVGIITGISSVGSG